MVTAFEDGETYRNLKLEKDIMVYATAKETPAEVTLAVGFVDRESYEMTNTGDITIKKEDFKDWAEVEID
jgi:hypothetical protein